MNSSPAKKDYEWIDYYKKFDYFSPSVVREGNHPRIMEHPATPKKAVVLVHGLTDSPFLLTETGKFFHERMGYNVYLPLLHFHGLRDPQGMEGVKLEEWKRNVNFAVDYAAERCRELSIGGLSTGGALSFYMIVNNPKVTGTLYLFSAALDLAGGIAGELKERLLRTFVANVLDNMTKDKPLVGDNPYRYSHIDLDGARELSILMKENDEILRNFNKDSLFPHRVFAAHSENDTTASITGIEDLQNACRPEDFRFFRIPKDLGVCHASLVLKNPIYAFGATSADEPLEGPNPLFREMLEDIAKFG